MKQYPKPPKGEDHPHAYGDKNVILHSIQNIKRIIPTRMGTSYHRFAFKMATPDHPHAYGDKFDVPMSPAMYSGSSPRVWGQAKAIAASAMLVGIIPTRMGTSCPYPDKIIIFWDHPHAYGDKGRTFLSLYIK